MILTLNSDIYVVRPVTNFVANKSEKSEYLEVNVNKQYYCFGATLLERSSDSTYYVYIVDKAELDNVAVNCKAYHIPTIGAIKDIFAKTYLSYVDPQSTVNTSVIKTKIRRFYDVF